MVSSSIYIPVQINITFINGQRDTDSLRYAKASHVTRLQSATAHHSSFATRSYLTCFASPVPPVDGHLPCRRTPPSFPAASPSRFPARANIPTAVPRSYPTCRHTQSQRPKSHHQAPWRRSHQPPRPLSPPRSPPASPGAFLTPSCPPLSAPAAPSYSAPGNPLDSTRPPSPSSPYTSTSQPRCNFGLPLCTGVAGGGSARRRRSGRR
jgi:hypothetical protein